MSSAILYGAIVVIWAGVLIPRWLRRETPAETSETTTPPVPMDDSPSSSAPKPAVGDAPAPQAPPAAPAPPAPPRRESERTRVVRARRRLLGMLVALAVASAGLAVMKLAAWWVVLPPTVMLVGYTLLLREASKADAERRDATRERRAESAAAAEAPVAPAAPVAPVAAPPVVAPVAEVIDITAHVSDPYDQYTDTKRVVGGNLALSGFRGPGGRSRSSRFARDGSNDGPAASLGTGTGATSATRYAAAQRGSARAWAEVC